MSSAADGKPADICENSCPPPPLLLPRNLTAFLYRLCLPQTAALIWYPWLCWPCLPATHILQILRPNVMQALQGRVWTKVPRQRVSQRRCRLRSMLPRSRILEVMQHLPRRQASLLTLARRPPRQHQCHSPGPLLPQLATRVACSLHSRLLLLLAQVMSGLGNPHRFAEAVLEALQLLRTACTSPRPGTFDTALVGVGHPQAYFKWRAVGSCQEIISISGNLF